MARAERNYRTKVLVTMKRGIRTETTFFVHGKNKTERAEAEYNTIVAIKRMICHEGHEYLCSYMKDEIIRRKR